MKKLLLLAVVVLAAGCAKDDLEDPTISLASPSEVTATYSTGQAIPFTATFSDDNLLSSYQVVISPNFENAPITAWEETIDGTLSDKLQLVEESIAIPDSIAAGEYTFAVSCTDDAGKDAEPISVLVNIVNTSDTAAPNLVISSPDPSSPLGVDPGVSFSVAGNVVDDGELYSLTISILDADGVVLTDESLEVSGSSHDFSKNLPSPTTSGSYTVKVEAVDSVNNRSVVEFTLLVS